jgi:hypothetical protein
MVSPASQGLIMDFILIRQGKETENAIRLNLPWSLANLKFHTR